MYRLQWLESELGLLGFHIQESCLDILAHKNKHSMRNYKEKWKQVLQVQNHNKEMTITYDKRKNLIETIQNKNNMDLKLYDIWQHNQLNFVMQ